MCDTGEGSPELEEDEGRALLLKGVLLGGEVHLEDITEHGSPAEEALLCS